MSNVFPLPKYKRESRNLTPLKENVEDVKTPTQSSSKKYAHVQPKVNSFWSPGDMHRAGVKKFFERKASPSTSASNSASSSFTGSPEIDEKKDQKNKRRSFQYQISGPDFTAKLNELKKGVITKTSTRENLRELGELTSYTPESEKK
ncbi:CLUMA_CG018878, isoform A [Clunio marinus]|uniref:CLUMA_CG018878, isoform A n=1 Tax=Clunio marinus TaxID=568069 RepID=A0A1J1J0Y6_9DIPT|nr:CLUMA_CG018878, isoform A [Clunio marinus]